MFSTVMTIPESQSVAAASSVQLYAGQSTECNLTLVNTSSVSVECFDLEFVHANRLAPNQVFSVRLVLIILFCSKEHLILLCIILSVENLKAQLPWQPGTAVSVTVYVQGASDFIMPAISDCPTIFPSAEDSNSLPSLSGLFALT